MLLPPVRQIGSRNSGGKFGPQGQRLSAAIFERIHLFRDNIGRLAKAAGKDLRLFKHRHFSAAKPVELAHTLKRVDHMGKTLGIATENILRAANGFGRVFAHALAPKGMCPLSQSLRSR